jgi:3-oxoacyl-[acyl-carrier-protein] synthase II
VAGEVRDFAPEDYIDRKQLRRMDRTQHFAMAAAEMAMQDAAYTVTPADAERAAVLIGSAVGGLAQGEAATLEAHRDGPGVVSPFFLLQLLINMAPGLVAIRHGFKGPNWSTSSARPCA